MSDQPLMELEGQLASRRGWLSEGGGYLLASAAALLADLGMFFLLAYMGWGWYIAATAGFLVGSIAAYIISVRWVFAARSFRSRSAELATFLLIGCLGLLVVQCVMWLCIEWFGVRGGTARVVAVGFSFTSNFVLRKLILFRSRVRDRSIGEREAA
ncbi:GtrA family protein [Stenotrophomonas pavanii]|uniref:GtrA family protein n=1 Tax=Stenotrophomonas pavanii TaxID=487698 RepID=UPI002E787962|nr:GtrA family protein [Stenotrophomonas pavanii]